MLLNRMNDEEMIVDVGVGDGKSALKGSPQPIMVMAWGMAMKKRKHREGVRCLCDCVVPEGLGGIISP